MAYQTVNPYDNQIVATFDDLTDEQAMDLLAQSAERHLSRGVRHRSPSAPLSSAGPRPSSANGPTSSPGC